MGDYLTIPEYVRVLAFLSDQLLILSAFFLPLQMVVGRGDVGQPFEQLHVFVLNPLQIAALVLDLAHDEVFRIYCALITNDNGFEFYFLHACKQFVVLLFDFVYSLFVLLDCLCIIHDAWVILAVVSLSCRISLPASI